MAKEKIRADLLMVERGLAANRSKAQALIMSGVVHTQDAQIQKPSQELSPDAHLALKGESCPYVSRGGIKLAKAIQESHMEIANKLCLDVGISTGGFTDCLLQSGARRVIGIDVGYGQLDWKIRSDERVTLFERTNFRHMDISLLDKPIQIVVMDVSFISILKLMPKLIELADNQQQGFEWIVLFKPQFEVGRPHVGKKGVVKDVAISLACLEETIQQLEALGFHTKKYLPSPIKGQEGNQEFLIWGNYSRLP